MSETYQKRLERIKARYPRAYEKWTAAYEKLNTPFHIRTQSRRTVLEELLLDHYKHQGFQLIN